MLSPGKTVSSQVPLRWQLKSMLPCDDSAPFEFLKMHSYASQGATQPNSWVIDTVIVEPGEWWLGAHLASRRAACWPGGVPRLTVRRGRREPRLSRKWRRH